MAHLRARRTRARPTGGALTTNDLCIHAAPINLYRKFVEQAERGVTDRDCL